MKQLTKLFFVAALALFTINAYSQKRDYSKEPGYISFGDLSSLETDDSGTEVFLEEHLLKMAARMSQKEDKDLANLISGLKLVKVNQFNVNKGNEAKIDAKVNSIDKELLNKNWDRIVKSKDKGETANVYIKTAADNKILGLVVMAYTKGKEVAFVNIVGDINLDAIGGLTEKFDIPGLKDVHSKKKH